jgi:hypothetical protein
MEKTMHITESKTLLAKLMATENLTVEQRNVQTASFNVKDRILTLPILDSKISPFLYDMFLGHEVGHALHTPLEGFEKAKVAGVSASVANVVEDSRIERKIKNKYPGIRSSFVKGYRELIEKDFFGTKGADLNDLNFIDRVNLYTKGGAAQGIQFNEYEKGLVDKVESTETYDDVIRVGVEIMQYMKEEAETAKKLKLVLNEFDEDEDGIEIDASGYEDSDDWDEETEIRESGKPIDSDGDENSDEMPEDNEEGDLQGGGMDPEGESDEQIKSHTDESYRKNESKLFSVDADSYYYGNIPDIDMSKAIVSYKQLWSEYRTDVDAFQERNSGYYDIKDGINAKKFKKIRNDAKKVVGYLAKEFELRKNAEQLKRASVSKTGELNMSKIYSYGFAEDIFKKITVVPNGKSHGLVMFLDWSGSMSNHIENTVKQLINLVMFCKKVNIPYEVYAFTSEHDRPYSSEFKEGDIALRNFKLMNFLSSRMSAVELTYACSALVASCEPRGWKPNWMQKGGTPLSEAIVSAMTIVPEFQKQYKLQIVNTVFLTDGDGHSLREVYQTNDGGHKTTGYGREYTYGKTKKLVIRDPKTRHEVIVDHPHGRELTSAYIKMLKLRTNSNIVGFYVLSGRELGRELYNFLPRSVTNHDKYKAEFRKNKSMVVTSSGYDEYYLLRAEGLDTDDDVGFEVKENATTRGLVSAFSKYAGNRLNNRVVLNRFVGMIS